MSTQLRVESLLSKFHFKRHIVVIFKLLLILLVDLKVQHLAVTFARLRILHLQLGHILAQRSILVLVDRLTDTRDWTPIQVATILVS